MNRSRKISPSKRFSYLITKTLHRTLFASLLIMQTFTLVAQKKKPSQLPQMAQQQYQAPQRGRITGTVIDEEFNEPLEKAVVTIPGTPISVLTDQHGNFYLDLVGGDYFIKINYPGYFEKQYNMSVSSDVLTPMYLIKLKANAVGREEQRKNANYGDKAQLPETLENFSTWTTTENIGHQDFNQLIQNIPSATLVSNGSGYNDSEISMRGNDPTRTSYTYNGILLNNPETGRISSAMYSGLTDWSEKIQTTTGQTGSLQTQTSYGGLINIQSTSLHKKFGTDIIAIYGNEGLMKTSATVHSGLSKKGLASSLLLSRTSGNGLAENTGFEQYSFSLNIFKEFNHRHTLVLGINSAIQQHDRNRADSIGNYNRFGTRFNRDWRIINGKPVSWTTNYGRSPLVSLTYYWTPKPHTQITTQIFAQFDRSAQIVPNATSVDILTIDKNKKIALPENPSKWNEGYTLFDTESTFSMEQCKNSLYKEFNSSFNFITTDKTDRYGIRSVVSRNISKEMLFSATLNLESYRAQHFGSQIKLAEEDNYNCTSDLNRPEGYTVEKLFQSGLFPSFNSADKVIYFNEANIHTGGIALHVDYQTKQIYTYLEGSASLQGSQRTDHFSYLKTNPQKRTDLEFIPGAHVQTGLKVNYWKYHSVYFRATYGTYQPLFATLFPARTNWKNTLAENEQNLGAEFGYTIFSRMLKIEALAYYSQTNNRSLIRRYQLINNDAFGLINGMNEIHQGIELKSSYKFSRNFQFYLNGSYGEWIYAKDAIIQLYDSENQETRSIKVWTKDLRIANTPQMSLFAEAEYRWANNFYVRLNYSLADQIYAPFNIYDSITLNDRKESKQWQLPSYQLLGASGNYLVKVSKALSLNFILGANNILDSEYIQQSYSNIPENDPSYTSNRVYYGTGRTWFAGVKIQF